MRSLNRLRWDDTIPLCQNNRAKHYSVQRNYSRVLLGDARPRCSPTAVGGTGASRATENAGVVTEGTTYGNYGPM